MEVHQVCELGPDTPVWVWIVRVGKGRWWPGSVLSITAVEPFPMIDTRFECRSAGKNGVNGTHHPDTMTADDQAARAVSAPPLKKSRARKKAKASIPTQVQDAPEVP